MTALERQLEITQDMPGQSASKRPIIFCNLPNEISASVSEDLRVRIYQATKLSWNYTWFREENWRAMAKIIKAYLLAQFSSSTAATSLLAGLASVFTKDKAEHFGALAGHAYSPIPWTGESELSQALRERRVDIYGWPSHLPTTVLERFAQACQGAVPDALAQIRGPAPTYEKYPALFARFGDWWIVVGEWGDELDGEENEAAKPCRVDARSSNRRLARATPQEVRASASKQRRHKAGTA